VIIDGGSTDESLEIIAKYERWLAYYESEPDRGQTHAINKGWLRATGDILAYLNTDDCYSNGTIAVAAREFSERPDVGMVYGTATIVNERNEQRTWKARPFDLKNMFTVGNIVPQPAVFFSRDALKKVGYLNEEWQMIMDYELCIRIGSQFPTVCLPRTLGKFRTHPQSKSRVRFEDTTQELIRYVKDFSPEQKVMPDWQRIKRTVMSRIHYELALGYVTEGHQAASKGFQQLLESLSLDPLFALRHPILTAHIIKRVLIGHFKDHGHPIAS
jgi:glycosyltransferase involved in cell wall biosynthesis